MAPKVDDDNAGQIQSLTAQLSAKDQEMSLMRNSLDEFRQQLQELRALRPLEDNSQLDLQPRVEANSRVPKIPPFLQSDPILWYRQVEAVFRRANITVDATKLDYIIMNLDSDSMNAIRDIIITDPLPADAYKMVKERLLTAFGSSAEAQLRQLLRGQVPGNLKPSRLLSYLRSKNSSNCNDDIIRAIFLENLPEPHRAILVSLADNGLDNLAKKADDLFELSASSYVNAVQSKPANVFEPVTNSFYESNPIQSLCNKLDSVLESLSKLNSSTENRSRSISRNKSNNSRSNSKSRNLCIAHFKYPNNPTSCKSWCAKFTEWSNAHKQKN